MTEGFDSKAICDAASFQREHVVDGKSYTLKGLSSDEEVLEWAQFCASVFSYKANPPPPSYFERHYHADPDRVHPTLIRVAIAEDGQVVASCRVFCRKLSTGSSGDAISAAGIGEVCTSSDHRRKGLSKALLLDCIQIMEQSQQFEVSILHAAPAFFPVYQSVGYCNCMVSENSMVTVNARMLLETSCERDITPTIRRADFPEDVTQLQTIHQEYSERRFKGCIVRSADYWNSYVAQELDDNLYVSIKNSEDKDQIRGWLAIRARGEGFQVRDFGCLFTENAARVFRELLQNFANVNNIAEDDDFQLQIPKPILDEVINDNSYLKEVNVEKDEGWMYKPIQNKGEASFSWNEVFNPESSHLIWSADSF